MEVGKLKPLYGDALSTFTEYLPLNRARAEFSYVVASAEVGRPVTITKYGHPAAVMISVAQFFELMARVPNTTDANKAYAKAAREALALGVVVEE